VIDEAREGLDDGWFADTLVLRVAERIGDRDGARQVEAAIGRRGSAAAARLRLLVVSGFGLALVGLVALCVPPRRRPAPPIGSAALPPTWPARDGWALFVRGLGVPQALAIAGYYVVRRESALEPAVGMLADLALFAWVLSYLRARAERPAAVFGLVPRPGSGGRLARITLGLIGLTLAADILIDLAGPSLGLRTHWSDGFPEDLLWSSRARIAVDTFGAVAWAPVVEELTFRGLLYGTLRTRMGALPAAALSAIVFVLPHDYGLAGSLSVLWSGLIWAVAYERTRSLLPAVLAHSANNAISTAWALVTLRL
jgi:membrane protease YdiL (CAAX protease family)